MFDYSKLNDYSKRKRGKNRDEVRAIDAQRKAHIAAQNAPKTAPIKEILSPDTAALTAAATADALKAFMPGVADAAEIAAQNAPKVALRQITEPSEAQWQAAEDLSLSERVSSAVNEAVPPRAATSTLDTTVGGPAANSYVNASDAAALLERIEVPANWRDLNWPLTRDLAAKIVGRDPASRSEARAILAAHANKGA
jgi:hypothetical protein